MIERTQLQRAFQELYGVSPRLFRAPGRVNLIGEHTDYNDGFVLPMALERETVVAAAPRTDRRVRVHALDLNEQAEFDLDQPGPRQRGIWLDYIEGVAQALERRGARLQGADMALMSDVPVGAGLSSSAALEVSTGLALLTLAGVEVDRVQLALAGQEAEHTYVGAKVGIMDQFIAALGRAGHALLIDCRALTTTLIPVKTERALVVICDTRVKHELAASEYNTRRAECEQGVELLKRAGLTDIRALRDVSVAEFARYGTRAARTRAPSLSSCCHGERAHAGCGRGAEARSTGGDGPFDVREPRVACVMITRSVAPSWTCWSRSRRHLKGAPSARA